MHHPLLIVLHKQFTVYVLHCKHPWVVFSEAEVRLLYSYTYADEFVFEFIFNFGILEIIHNIHSLVTIPDLTLSEPFHWHQIPHFAPLHFLHLVLVKLSHICISSSLYLTMFLALVKFLSKTLELAMKSSMYSDSLNAYYSVPLIFCSICFFHL